MFFSRALFWGLPCFVFMVALLPSSDLSASLFKTPQKILDPQTVDKIWSHVPASDVSIGNPLPRKPSTKQAASSSSVGKHRSKQQPEVRWFRGRVLGRGYLFEMSKDGYVRAFDKKTRKIHGDLTQLAFLDFDGLEWLKVRRQLSRPLREARLQRPVRASSRGKQKKSVGGAEDVVFGITTMKPASRQILRKQVAKGAAGGRVEDATRGSARTRKADLEDRIAALAAALDQGAPVLRRDISPLKKLTAAAEERVREMLPFRDRLSLSQVSKRFQGLHEKEQQAIQKRIELAYNRLRELDEALKAAKGDEATAYWQQHTVNFRELWAALWEDLKPYERMSNVEKEGLFYVTNTIQLKGDAEEALRLLNTKGVTLEKLKIYDAERAEAVLMIYMRARRFMEVAEAIYAGDIKGIPGAQIFALLGEAVGGAKASVHTNLDAAIKAFYYRADPRSIPTSVRRDSYPPFTREMEAKHAKKLIEAFALQGTEFKMGSDASMDIWAEVLGALNEYGYMVEFLNSDTVSVKSKVMLGISLRENGIELPGVVEAALGRLGEYAGRDKDFFFSALYYFARLPGVEDRKVVEFVYDYLYANSSHGRSFQQQVTRGEALLPWRDNEAGNNAIKRFTDEVAEEAGGHELSAKLQAFRSLQLAERALHGGKKYDEVIRYAQSVLDATDPRVRSSSAVIHARELKSLALSGKVQESQGATKRQQTIVSAQKKKGIEEGLASYEAKARSLATKANFFRDRAQWYVSQGDAEAAVHALWHANRFEFLNVLTLEGAHAVSRPRELDSIVEELSKKVDDGVLEMEPRIHGYLEELTQHRDPGHVVDLKRVPEEYHTDALYQVVARKIDTNRVEDEEILISQLQQILARNPPASWRAYAHFHLGELLVRRGGANEEARLHLKKALRSEVFPIGSAKVTGKHEIRYYLDLLKVREKTQALKEMREARRRMGRLPKEEAKKSQKQITAARREVTRAQNELFQKARKAKNSADGYYAYILSQQEESMTSLSQTHIERLLSAYHFAIMNYEQIRGSSPQLLEELYRGRAKLSRSHHGMNLQYYRKDAPKITVEEASLVPDEMPAEMRRKTLDELAEEDEAFALSLQGIATEATVAKVTQKTSFGGAGRK